MLASQIQERLQTISLCDEWTEYMFGKITKWEQEETTSSQSDVRNLSDRIKASEARLEKLVSMYLDGDIPKEIYLKKKDENMRATLALKKKKKDFEHGSNNWVEPLREWVLDTKQANFLSSSDNFKEIASFVKKVGTNPLVRDKTVSFGVSVPSQFVAKRRVISPFSFSCAPAARSSFSLTSEEVSECDLCGIRTTCVVAGILYNKYLISYIINLYVQQKQTKHLHILQCKPSGSTHPSDTL